MALPPEAHALLQSLKKVGIRALKTAGAAVLDQSLADADEIFEAGKGMVEHYQDEARKARSRIPRSSPPFARGVGHAPVDPVPNVSETACPDCLQAPGKVHLKICPRR